MNYMCFIYYWHYSCARQVQSWIVVTDNEMLISQTGQFKDTERHDNWLASGISGKVFVTWKLSVFKFASKSGLISIERVTKVCGRKYILLFDV